MKASELCVLLADRIAEYGDLEVRKSGEESADVDYDYLANVSDVRMYKRTSQSALFVVD